MDHELSLVAGLTAHHECSDCKRPPDPFLLSVEEQLEIKGKRTTHFLTVGALGAVEILAGLLWIAMAVWRAQE